MKRQDLKNLILKSYDSFDYNRVSDGGDYPEGLQYIDERWYYPLNGCDTIQEILNKVKE